jgi:hypothetical protein
MQISELTQNRLSDGRLWKGIAMGEAQRKKRSHAAILAAGEDCIYCAGKRPISSIEHMPPRAMFKRKERPKGLEFGCCKVCNEKTKNADQVASMIGRIYPDSKDLDDHKDIQKLINGVGNNIPGLLAEMYLRPHEQAVASRKFPPGIKGKVLSLEGGLVKQHLNVFSAKIGFALHREATGAAVPASGAVFARWYPNLVVWDERHFPKELWSMLPPPSTLRQGKKHVWEQFRFSCETEKDGALGMFIATFRESFAVVAFSATERRLIEKDCPYPEQLWSPGELVEPSAVHLHR